MTCFTGAERYVRPLLDTRQLCKACLTSVESTIPSHPWTELFLASESRDQNVDRAFSCSSPVPRASMVDMTTDRGLCAERDSLRALLVRRRSTRSSSNAAPSWKCCGPARLGVALPGTARARWPFHFYAHVGPVWSVAFSADGAGLQPAVTMGREGVDAHSGTLLLDLKGHTSVVRRSWATGSGLPTRLGSLRPLADSSRKMLLSSIPWASPSTAPGSWPRRW